MQISRFFLFLGSLLLSVSTLAQEQLLAPANNRVLQTLAVLRTNNVLDTIGLPFIDDFSDSDVHPNPLKWVDRDVFVNKTLAHRPPGVGVATFDGLDPQGKAYDNSSFTTYGQADFLSSQAIDLSANQAADSLYLSFFLQPQGYGDAPEVRDSIVLQFFDSAGNWTTQFSRPGATLDTFKQEMIALTDPVYFHAGFRFRFINYASLTGLVDLWHLDYVRLAAFRSQNDTLLDDVAYAGNPGKLFQTYTSLPYSHYLADSARWRSSQHGAPAVNLGLTKNTSFNYQVTATHDNSQVFQSTPFGITFDGSSNFTYNSPLFAIPALPRDSLTLALQYRLSATPDARNANDTVSRIHHLWNHYAYDDGTAEAAYGLNVLAGQLAYKFRISKPDTLRGIQLYFVQTTENVASELFNLKVWSYIPEGQIGGSELLLTEQVLLTPEYADSIGQFVYYPLDQPVWVSDSVYIGWQQGTNKILNIGLDRNDTVRNAQFFNATGSWELSTIAGAWMMRPVFGKAISWPTATKKTEQLLSKIYPNPAATYVTLELAGRFEWQLIDMQGRIVTSGKATDNYQLDLQMLSNGLYHIRLLQPGRGVAFHKLIISR
jgi:hypothetical protein